jgi:hypothetical protein
MGGAYRSRGGFGGGGGGALVGLWEAGLRAGVTAGSREGGKWRGRGAYERVAHGAPVDMVMGVGVQGERGPWWGWWRGSCGLVGGGFESRSDGREQGGREMTAERSAEAGESDFGS